MGCCSSDRYALKIDIIRAENLPDVDIRGKCDPYVEIEVDGDKEKTTTKKNEQNPTWNECITFEDVRLGKQIMFRLMDWDRLTSNDLVGSCELREVLPGNYNESKELDFELLKDGKGRGRLYVKVEFIHEGAD
eukprot:543498_1